MARIRYHVLNRDVTIGDMRWLMQLVKEGAASDAAIYLLQSWLSEELSIADIHAMPLEEFYFYLAEINERCKSFQAKQNQVALAAESFANASKLIS